ncbi:hypothetical protein OA79_17070 [Marinomonas sp. TW1]|nr:hypothetical protein OA79_17070 [Marinomonas sp. TW1]
MGPKQSQILHSGYLYAILIPIMRQFGAYFFAALKWVGCSALEERGLSKVLGTLTRAMKKVYFF